MFQLMICVCWGANGGDEERVRLPVAAAGPPAAAQLGLLQRVRRRRAGQRRAAARGVHDHAGGARRRRGRAQGVAPLLAENGHQRHQDPGQHRLATGQQSLAWVSIFLYHAKKTIMENFSFNQQIFILKLDS